MDERVMDERGTGRQAGVPATTPTAASLGAGTPTTAAFGEAIAVAVCCVALAGVLFALLLGSALVDLSDDTVDAISGYLGLGSVAVGAAIGQRVARLPGRRAWLITAIGTFLCAAALVAVDEAVAILLGEPLPGDVVVYLFVAGTIGWFLLRRRERSSVLAAAVAIACSLASAAVLLLLDDRPADWLALGISAAVITGLLILWGISVQRSDPRRRWPVILVGLAAGLVAGLAILQAMWAESRWPHRRGVSDGLAASIGAVVMLLAVWSLFEAPFGLGPPVEAGRIERPASGYALTLPDSWRIEDVSGVRELLGETVPTGVTYDLLAVADEGGQMAMVMVMEDEGSISPQLLALGLRLALVADDFEDVRSEAVLLPSGESARIDAVHPDGMKMSVYVVSPDGPTCWVLYFFGERPPQDRWLSIAETFEFLPIAPAVTPG